MLTFTAQKIVTETINNRKHSYGVNYTQALSTMRDTIIILFQESTSAIRDLDSDVLRTFAMATKPGGQSRNIYATIRECRKNTV